MKNAVVGVMLVLFLAFPLEAQPKYVIQWQNTLNIVSGDYAFGVAVDGSGNVYITGFLYNWNNSSYDYLTAKYDSLGNIAWIDTLDNGDYDEARDIAVDRSGNVYVTGWAKNGSYYDYLTIKYDSLGNIIWGDTLNNGNDRAEGIAVDVSGNVYVTGISPIGSNDDYFTVKYDSLGNIIWERALDNGNTDYGKGVAVDGSGNVYVTGYSNNGSNYDYLTVKYDSMGNIIWIDTLDNGGDDKAYGIAVDGSGNVYVTGYFDNGSNDDYLTIKYDSMGNILWADTLDNGSDDKAYGIAVDESGNVYVTGYFDNGSNDDYLTVKYDSMGNIIWADTLNNGRDDEAYGIAVDGSGNVYVTGSYFTGSDWNCLTVKYVKYKDASILSITSPDTVGTDGSYTPEVWVKNNSYEDAFNFDISVYIDSSGTNMYADTQFVSGLAAGDSVLVSFSPWTAPSFPMNLNLSFSIITSDMNTDNDTISKTLYIKDLTPPVIDSAVAFDGTNHQLGIDNDDYVILYFSEPTNKPNVDNSNINSVLSLSGGHTWLDGAGNTGTCVWNTDGDQLQINFTTNTSLPTIAIGDTITPDGATITDLNNNPCSSPVILGGSFGYFVDAGILSITSPDTVGTDSIYTPEVWVINNSYEDILSFGIAGHIDSIGGNMYTDTQFVSDLAVGDSVLVSFSPWTALSIPMSLNLSFFIITPDMDTDNDTISKVIYVENLSGINDTRETNTLSLNTFTINKGQMVFTYSIPENADYTLGLYTADGRMIKEIKGNQKGLYYKVITGIRGGIYFLRLTQNKNVVTKKVIIGK